MNPDNDTEVVADIEVDESVSGDTIVNLSLTVPHPTLDNIYKCHQKQEKDADGNVPVYSSSKLPKSMN